MTETEFRHSDWLAIAKKGSETIHYHLKEEKHGFFQQAGKILTQSQKSDLAQQYLAEYEKYKRKDKDSLGE